MAQLTQKLNQIRLVLWVSLALALAYAAPALASGINSPGTTGG